MIRYLDSLYLTEAATTRASKFKTNVHLGIGMVGLYVITISSGEKDVFDIYSVTLFKQRSFRKRNFDIIGFAENEEAAFKLVQSIYEEYYLRNRTYSGMRAYFASQFVNQ